MRATVLGAGRMGAALARDLLDLGARRVTVADSDPERLSRLAARTNDRRLHLAWADFASPPTLRPLYAGTDVVAAAVPNALAAALGRPAVERGVSYVDLCGSDDVLGALRRLAPLARRTGAYVLPGCGLMPGLGAAVAGELHRRLGAARKITVLVGGLPRRPAGPLRHALFFSFDGLLHEYTAPARVLRRGRVALRRPLTDVRAEEWPSFPPLESFHTGGSSSSLPDSFRGKVCCLEVRTLRYRGHVAAVQALRRRTGRWFADALRRALPEGARDVVLLRVVAIGAAKALTAELVAEYDPATRATAMMRTTALPAALVARLAARRALGPPGVVLHEEMPARRLLADLAARGLRVRISAAASS